MSSLSTINSLSSPKPLTEHPKASQDATASDVGENCPATCVCPNVAMKSKEHAKTGHAKEWIDTKEGQDHLKICVASCPYRKLNAKKHAEAKGEEAQKTDAEKKNLEDHLKICVPDCPYRPQKEAKSSSKPESKITEELEEYEVVIASGEKLLRL